MRSITSFETQSVSGGNSLGSTDQCGIQDAPFEAVSNIPKNFVDTIAKTLGTALPYFLATAAQRNTKSYNFMLVPAVQFVLCTVSDILYEQATR